VDALAGRELEQGLGRLVPGVHAEVEGAPVHGQEAASPEQSQRRERVLRPEVDVSPGGVKGAHLQHDEIEGAEAGADLLVLGGEPGVAAEEHRCFGPRTTKDDQKVELRPPRPRPEKCCEGAAVMESSAAGSRALCHQSSSVMRSAGTPQASR
jgi:hypothetical protein